MARDAFPSDLKSAQKSPTPLPNATQPLSSDENLEQRKLEALKKSQEVLNNALEF